MNYDLFLITVLLPGAITVGVLLLAFMTRDNPEAKERGRMILDPHKLGGALLAAAPMLIQFGSSKWVWWMGIAFSVAGPFLLSLQRRQTKGKSCST